MADDQELSDRLDALDARWTARLHALKASGFEHVPAVRAVADGRIVELEADPELQAFALRRYETEQRPYKLDKALARSLGMPRSAIPMHAPVGRRGEFTVEMFGESLTDGPPLDAPAAWPGWQAGPGPVPAERLNEIFGDSLPADERARMMAGRPALNIRAWRIIIRRDDRAAFLEARRDRAGVWDVMVRGLGPAPKVEALRAIQPGLALLRVEVRRAGGRPPGPDVAEGAQRAAVKKYRRLMDTRRWPPSKWLAGDLRVSLHTAEKYLRSMKNAG